MLRRFLIAFQFMTVFRFRESLAETEEDWAASVAYYPLVGLILGGLLAGCGYVLGLVFAPGLKGLLLVLLLVIFTHGLHLDGLADTADGLFSHREKARRLEIMKDSRVGVFGVVALVFVLGLKALALADLAGPRSWAVVCLFPLWGRWACAVTMCLSTYARAEGGLGQPFINLAGTRELSLAGATALVCSFVLLGLVGLVVALIVALAAVLGVPLWRRTLGGLTGDTCGAVTELGEVLGLLAAAVFI